MRVPDTDAQRPDASDCLALAGMTPKGCQVRGSGARKKRPDRTLSRVLSGPPSPRSPSQRNGSGYVPYVVTGVFSGPQGTSRSRALRPKREPTGRCQWS